ncbi:hypothetical protein DFH11DRAFT_1500099, partial [Phellopilus nigrolimitatus]
FPSRTGSQLNVPGPTPPSSTFSTTPRPPFITQPPALVLHARASPSSSSCSNTPNGVLLEVSMQVIIPDYSKFYTATPIAQFRMAYTSLPDGSLIAPPLFSEVQEGNRLLIFAGMMLMLFLRNTIVSADYIRRGRVRYKGLFYALFISQFLGVVTFILIAASVLAIHIDCKSVFIASGIFTEISGALLLSGILGVKAYRCLNDHKVVLAVLVLLQTASSALVFASLFKLDATRNLSMSCIPITNIELFSLSVAVRFVIALFICLCFLYALWKSAKLPAAQGRISIRLSEQTPTGSVLYGKEEATAARPRGWWDYVPDSNPSQSRPQESRTLTWHLVDDQGFVQNMRYMVGTWMNDKPVPENRTRKGSDATLVAQSNQSHRSLVHFKDITENSHFNQPPRASSPTPSNTRNLRSLMTGMKSFREVMRNELAHTALITLFNVIATIISLIGAFGHMRASESSLYFFSSYWAILSLLVLHSSGRVVERHEREALLQHPSAWDPLYHVEKATNGNVRHAYALSSASVASNSWRSRRPTGDTLAEENEPIDPRDVPTVEKDISSPIQNPFEDFEFVGLSLGDEGREGCETSSPARSSILLPDGPRLSSIQGRYRNPFYTPRLQPRSPSSISKYSDSKYSSDTSSRPQSLFYLEEKR